MAASEFLSQISHELRTPAAAIVGVLRLALKRPLDQATRHDLELALNQAEAHLANLNGLLQPAQMHAGIPIPNETTTEVKHRLKILLVDDVATNRYIARSMLKDLGQSVEEAENGKEACLKLADQRFDLILMDMRMPIMDGPTAAQCIRQGGLPDFPILDSRTRILALTANEGEAERQECVAAGMDGFLTKPLRDLELRDELAKAISEQQLRGFHLPWVDTEEEKSWLPASDHAGSKDQDSEDPAAMLQKLQQLWQGEAPKHISTLREALELGDFESLSRVAHTVKGSARYLNFPHLEEVAEMLETAVDSHFHPSDLEQLTAGVEVAIQMSLGNTEVTL